MQRLRHDQKVRIAQCLLLAKQIKENGLEGIAAGQVSRGDVHTADGLVEQITEGYTYEAGVRWVERELGKVCRAKAVEFSRARQDAYGPEVRDGDVDRVLGVAKFEQEVREEQRKPGVLTLT